MIKGEWPKTVLEAINVLIDKLSPEEKLVIFQTSEDELYKVEKDLGLMIRNELGIWSNNNALIESCKSYTDYAGFETPLHPDFVTATIIKELWKRLSN